MYLEETACGEPWAGVIWLKIGTNGTLL